MADLETSHATLDHTGLTGVSGSVATDAIWDASGDLAVGSGANTAAKLTKGSDGTVLTVTAGAVGWAAPASGGGWGNHFLVPHAVPFTADAGTWVIAQFTAEDTYPFGGWALSCTSGSLNDAVSLPAIAMDAGTWAIDYVIRRSTNTGIITIKIAGSSVGTIDTYVSPGGHISSGAITGISIASSGSKTLQLVMATKNASSSGYFVGLFTLNFRRTA